MQILHGKCGAGYYLIWPRVSNSFRGNSFRGGEKKSFRGNSFRGGKKNSFRGHSFRGGKKNSFRGTSFRGAEKKLVSRQVKKTRFVVKPRLSWSNELKNSPRWVSHLQGVLSLAPINWRFKDRQTDRQTDNWRTKTIDLRAVRFLKKCFFNILTSKKFVVQIKLLQKKSMIIQIFRSKKL